MESNRFPWVGMSPMDNFEGHYGQVVVISRLALGDSFELPLQVFRDIPFHRGLNIVEGVELPDDAGVDAAHPVTLSGHSVGKTTLCRLIRYCLGEGTFGNKGAMSRIRNAFPEGWVGMELTLAGEAWAVRKSIGKSGNSMAAPGLTIEALFALNPKDNQYAAYIQRLKSVTMGGLAATHPPNSQKPYTWQHLLAWLTRDQEARFQSLHEWRNARSGSGPLGFDKRKEDALYLIRLVLDLLPEEELKLATDLAQAERELEKVKHDISELGKVPAYQLNEQERVLRVMIGPGSGEDVDFNGNDCASAIFQRRAELEAEIARLEKAIEGLDWRLARIRDGLASSDEQRKHLRSLIELTEMGIEPESVIGPEEDTLQRLHALRGKDCTYGNIRFSECSYVQQRLAEVGKIVNFEQAREAKRVAEATEQALQLLEQQRKDDGELLALLQTLRADLEVVRKEKSGLERELVEQRTALHRLDHHAAQRQGALDLIEGRTANTALQRAQQRRDVLQEQIERAKEQLEAFQAMQKEQRDAIGAIYDRLIKSALSDTYSGTLHMYKGELSFQIREETGLSGEAVETLAIVLADVAAMMAACEGIGHHPRFLVHDSPREADLDRHIYDRYLRAMWKLTTDHGGKDAAPFQYIVTTTSRPPAEVQEAICLKLQARPESNMLFGKRLKNPEPEGELFPPDEAASTEDEGE